MILDTPALDIHTCLPRLPTRLRGFGPHSQPVLKHTCGPSYSILILAFSLCPVFQFFFFLWPLNLEALYVHSQMIPICPLLSVTSLRVIQGLLAHHTCMRTLTLNPSTFGSPQYPGLIRTLGHLLAIATYLPTMRSNKKWYIQIGTYPHGKTRLKYLWNWLWFH